MSCSVGRPDSLFVSVVAASHDLQDPESRNLFEKLISRLPKEHLSQISFVGIDSWIQLQLESKRGISGDEENTKFVLFIILGVDSQDCDISKLKWTALIRGNQNIKYRSYLMRQKETTIDALFGQVGSCLQIHLSLFFKHESQIPSLIGELVCYETRIVQSNSKQSKLLSLSPEQLDFCSNLIDMVCENVEQGESSPILINAEPGAGKSTTLQAVASYFSSMSDTHSVLYYPAKSTCPSTQYRRLCNKILDLAHIHDGMNEQAKKLIRRQIMKNGLDEVLFTVKESLFCRKIIVIIDDFEVIKAHKCDTTVDTHWIPHKLPTNIAVVLSTSLADLPKSFDSKFIPLSLKKPAIESQLSILQKSTVSLPIPFTTYFLRSLVETNDDSGNLHMISSLSNALNRSAQNEPNFSVESWDSRKSLKGLWLLRISDLEEKYGANFTLKCLASLAILNVSLAPENIHSFMSTEQEHLQKQIWWSFFEDLSYLVQKDEKSRVILCSETLRQYILSRSFPTEMKLESIYRSVIAFISDLSEKDRDEIEYALETCRLMIVISDWAGLKSFLEKPYVARLFCAFSMEREYSNLVNIMATQINYTPDWTEKYLMEYSPYRVYILQLCIRSNFKQISPNVQRDLLKSTHVMPWHELYEVAEVMSSLCHYERSLSLLNKALQSVETFSSNQSSSLQFIIRMDISNILLEKGSFLEAREYSMQTLSFSLSAFGKRHPNSVQAYHMACRVLTSLEQYDSAMAMFLSGFESCKQVYGFYSKMTADLLISKAQISASTKYHDDAIESIQTALSILSVLYSDTSIEVALCRKHLATVFRSQRRFEEAHFIYNSISQLLSLSAKYEINDVAAIFMDIGILYEAQDMKLKAMEFFMKAFSVFDSCTHKNMTGVSRVTFSLAGLYWKMDRKEESMGLLIKLSGLPFQSIGELAMARSRLSELGHQMEEMDRNEEAIRCFFAAHKITNVFPGSESAISVDILLDIAKIYRKMKSYADAYVYFQNARALQAKLYGEYHSDIATTYRSLAALDGEIGRTDSAICNLSLSLQIELRATEQNILEIAILYTKLGELNESMQRTEISLDYYQQAHRHYQKVPQDHHQTIERIKNKIESLCMFLKQNMLNACRTMPSKTASSVTVLSTAYNIKEIQEYAEQLESGKRYEEARNCYFSILGVQIRIYGENHADVANSYNSIGLTFRKQEKYEDVLRSYQKALDIQLIVLGSNHLHVAVTYNNMGMVYRKMKRFEDSLKMLGISLQIMKGNRQATREDTEKLQHNIEQVRLEAGERQPQRPNPLSPPRTRANASKGDDSDESKNSVTCCNVS